MTIVHPLIGMVVLTLLVAIRLLYFAINSTVTGKVHIKQFRIYDGEFPTTFQSVRQHYKNMFEIPILFYILCILLIINNNYTQFDVIVAWGFVLFRVLHSLARIPIRDVNLRFGLFIGSFIMLVISGLIFCLNFCAVNKLLNPPLQFLLPYK